MARLWGVLFVAAALAACAQQPAAQHQPTQAELVARGQYIVTGIGGCNDCHTPMTPQGPDMAHSLQGSTLAIRLTPQFEGHIPWAEAAPQIAGGPAGYTRRTIRASVDDRRKAGWNAFASADAAVPHEC